MILNNVQEINNNQQWVFVTLTVDGDDCEFTHVAPGDLSGQDLQDFVDAREDAYALDILRDMYPDAPNFVRNTRPNFEQWILDGAIVPAHEDSPEYIAIKIPWTNKHPDIISVGGTERQDMITAAKDMIASLSFSDIDDHIDMVFGNLSTVQKNSLKKLYKATLFLLRK